MTRARHLLAALAVGAATVTATGTARAASDPVDECGTWWNIGPNGWTSGFATCWHPERRNIEFQVRLRLVRKSDGETVYLFGNRESCPGYTSAKSFQTDRFIFVGIAEMTFADELADGC